MTGVSTVVRRDLEARDIRMRSFGGITEIDIGTVGLSWLMTYAFSKGSTVGKLTNKTLIAISKFTPPTEPVSMRMQSASVMGYDRHYQHVYFYLNGSPVRLFKSLPPSSSIDRITLTPESKLVEAKEDQVITLTIQPGEQERLINGELIEISPSLL